MYYFSSKCSKIASPLIFNFGKLKLRNFTKLWFFKLILTKSNFKKINYDVIAITSPKNVTEITSQNFSILPLLSPIKISGYASVGGFVYNDCFNFPDHRSMIVLLFLLGYLIRSSGLRILILPAWFSLLRSEKRYYIILIIRLA